jgi:hypothetical protein
MYSVIIRGQVDSQPTYGGEVVSLTCRCHFATQKYFYFSLWYTTSVRG